MIRFLGAAFLIIFSIIGAYFYLEKYQFKEIPDLVRNYVLISIPKKEEKEIIIKFTGDNILARSVNYLTVKNNDFIWAYKNIAEDLKDADLTVINLESPLLKNCPLTNEGFIFCGDFRNTIGLSHAGIDIVGMANNHAGNYGKEGLSETIQHLDNAGILSSGVEERQIAYKKIDDTQFAFLAFNSIYYEGSGVLNAQEDLIKNLLKEAKAKSDFIVVQMHWGTEYTRSPNEYQKRIGRFLIDNGADIVVGNHPHWIQDYEIYNGKYIFYALGNFIFDQEWSQETKEGVIVSITIQNKKVKDINFTPIEIRDYGQVFKTKNFDIIPKEIK
jgi:poly-gamma-glutamate capsule biosynthesis protein CapA/YwtB (metallophosphatase superfamily)